MEEHTAPRTSLSPGVVHGDKISWPKRRVDDWLTHAERRASVEKSTGKEAIQRS